jgi:hypothetical protein
MSTSHKLSSKCRVTGPQSRSSTHPSHDGTSLLPHARVQTQNMVDLGERRTPCQSGSIHYWPNLVCNRHRYPGMSCPCLPVHQPPWTAQTGPVSCWCKDESRDIHARPTMDRDSFEGRMSCPGSENPSHQTDILPHCAASSNHGITADAAGACQAGDCQARQLSLHLDAFGQSANGEELCFMHGPIGDRGAMGTPSHLSNLRASLRCL